MPGQDEHTTSAAPHGSTSLAPSHSGTGASSPSPCPAEGPLVAQEVLILATLYRTPGRETGGQTLSFTYLSPNCESLIGVPPQALIDDPGLSIRLMHPDDREHEAAARADALSRSPFREQVEVRLRDGTGHWRWVRLLLEELPQSPGTVVGVAVDTSQDAIERALRESEARLQTFFQNAHSSAYMKAADGRYLMVNERFLDNVGHTREEVIGRTDADLFGAVADGYVGNDQLVIDRGEQMLFDEDFPMADGVHHFLSSKFPLVDEAGTAYAMCGLSLDITDRKAAADAAEAARLEA